MDNRSTEKCATCGAPLPLGPPCNCCHGAPPSSNLWSIHVDLIRMAAQLVRGEGVPDWSEHTFYRSTPVGERRDMMKALRDADEALRSYGSRLKAIADKVAAEIRAPETRDVLAEIRALLDQNINHRLIVEQIDALVRSTAKTNGEPASKEAAYRETLVDIRHRLRSDPPDFETAVIKVRGIYTVANEVLMANGDGFASPRDVSPVLDHKFLPDAMDPGICQKCGSTRLSHRGEVPRTPGRE